MSQISQNNASGADLVVETRDPIFGSAQEQPLAKSSDTYRNNSRTASRHMTDSSRDYSMYDDALDETTSSRRKAGKRRINKNGNEGKACCKTECAVF